MGNSLIKPYRTLHRAFEIQAAKTPNAVALVFKDKTLTYKKLNQQANHLARTLKNRLVSLVTDKTPIVLVSVERGFNTVVSALAVLKAGACYVPVEPYCSTQRIEFILNNSSASIIVCEKHLSMQFKNSELFILEDYQKASLHKNCKDFRRLSDETSIDDPAYIVYTAVSTGKPESLVVNHLDVINLVYAQINQYNLTQEDRILGFSSLSFDAAAREIYSALLSGATLCLAAKEDVLPGQPLLDTLCENKITIGMGIPPSLLSVTPYTDIADLRMMIMGDEICPESLVEIEATFMLLDKKVHIDPRTQQERTLVELWQEMLHVDRIGIYDNFFALGGHPLLAAQLALRIQETFQIECSVKAIFNQPIIVQLALFIQKQLNRQSKNNQPIDKADREELLPFSFFQKHLWLLDYNISIAIRLLGDLNISRLKKCFNFLIARHESLRTIFESKGEEVYQKIMLSAQCNFEIEPVNKFHLENVIAEELCCPFDLLSGPLMRLRMFKLDTRHHVLLINQHRTISDNRSIGILLRELSILYVSDESQWQAYFPPLEIQYADYAVWQKKILTRQNLEAQYDYWRGKLENFTTLRFPATYKRPAFKAYNCKHHYFYLGRDLLASVKLVQRTAHTTLFNLLLSAFSILLGRYSGQDDVLIGSPISETHRDTINVVGCFVNMLALRIDLSGSPNFLTVLERVKQTCLEAYVHQDMPFERLIDMLQVEIDTNRTPIFQIVFLLHNARDELTLVLPGIDEEVFAPSYNRSPYDITFHVSEMAAGLGCDIEYNMGLFSAESMAVLARDFEILLRKLVKNVKKPVLTLSPVANTV